MNEVRAMVSRNSLSSLFPWIVLALVAAVTPTRAAPGELALERVMLSSGGVGYFEYSAEIEGDAELALKVNLDQVDDVLKSIVIYDDAGGVGQVRLPGREPLTQVFRDLPFGPDALETPAALLNSLQGAEVRATGDRDLEGRILGARAETVTLPDGLGTTVRHRVSLITPEGVRQFILEQAETVAFTDPELQAQVNEALEAIAAHRVQDSRTLTIAAEGAGRRTVRVGYVIAVPLWKTSYRLGLPALDEQDRRLESFRTFFARDRRLLSVNDRAYEGLNLLLKWVAVPVFYFLDQNRGEAAWIPARGFSHGFDYAPIEIDRNVLVVLEDAHSSFRFETDSACNNIRDAAVSELDSGVRNVLRFREHRRTSRIRRPNG